MKDRHTQKVQWLAWVVLASSIVIALCILLGAGIYAGRLGIKLGMTMTLLVGFALQSGMKFIALPLGVLNLVLLIFAADRFNPSTKIVGTIFGLLGMTAGVFFWALYLLSTASAMG